MERFLTQQSWWVVYPLLAALVIAIAALMVHVAPQPSNVLSMWLGLLSLLTIRMFACVKINRQTYRYRVEDIATSQLKASRNYFKNG